MDAYSVSIAVRYGETDQMGVVHHGNYAQYLELARIEWLSNLGISYQEMEKNGLMLPVYEMNIRYLRPAHFGDLLKIEIRLVDKPGVKIKFEYKIFNDQNQLLTEAHTVLVFMDAETRKPTRCPQYLLEVFGY